MDAALLCLVFALCISAGVRSILLEEQRDGSLDGFLFNSDANDPKVTNESLREKIGDRAARRAPLRRLMVPPNAEEMAHGSTKGEKNPEMMDPLRCGVWFLTWLAHYPPICFDLVWLKQVVTQCTCINNNNTNSLAQEHLTCFQIAELEGLLGSQVVHNVNQSITSIKAQLATVLEVPISGRPLQTQA